MPSKYYLRNFQPNHYYHVYNRGAYKNNIFLKQKDYQTFISILSYYIKHPLAKKYSYTNTVKHPYILVTNQYLDSVHLVSYCLMPNHFHLLLKQTPKATDQTNISNLMRRLTITYSMYFQEKYQHSGALFQGRYKNVLVKTEEQLLHLTRYIHQNPKKLTKNIADYPHSSLKNYLGKINQDWVKPNEILSYFSKTNPSLSYSSFVQEKDPNQTLITSLTLD